MRLFTASRMTTVALAIVAVGLVNRVPGLRDVVFGNG